MADSASVGGRLGGPGASAPPRAEGHHEEVRLGRRQRPSRLRRVSRRGARAAGGERRRQVDADVASSTGCTRPTRARSCVDGEPVVIDSPADGDPARDRHGPPALHAGPGDDRGREHRARPRARRGRRPARPEGRKRRASASCRIATGWPSTPTPRSRTSTVGTQQRVEILRALYREARILVLDEPTAVLTAQEVQRADRGAEPAQAGRHRRSCSSATSSTRCCEVADRITVLRRGKKIGTVPARGRHRAEPGPDGGRPRRASVGGEASREAPGPDPRGRRARGPRRPRPAWPSTGCR